MAEPGDTSVLATAKAKSQKSHELASCVIKDPIFSYAHLQVLTGNPHQESIELDALQVRSYCTSALQQFLGIAGTAISIDILKVDGADCWLRIPRDNLGAFSAAITAWRGTNENGVHVTFQIKGCSDWLGSLVGRVGQDTLWSK
ncbi:Ribonuclease P [Apiospora arundinis]|uniref:Ribonuclease P n=1 Tax=Apiospora arundinis TaxID=335852 RepID=A0ABR2I3B0_9PEZI